MPVVQYRIGDTLELRKRHPCGGVSWVVVRLGADIGLRCLTCGRRVLLERAVLERRTKKFLTRVDDVRQESGDGLDQPPAGSPAH
jgi:hypothetical protein